MKRGGKPPPPISRPSSIIAFLPTLRSPSAVGCKSRCYGGCWAAAATCSNDQGIDSIDVTAAATTPRGPHDRHPPGKGAREKRAWGERLAAGPASRSRWLWWWQRRTALQQSALMGGPERAKPGQRRWWLSAAQAPTMRPPVPRSPLSRHGFVWVGVWFGLESVDRSIDRMASRAR